MPAALAPDAGYDAGFGCKAAHQVAELLPNALDLNFLLRHGAALEFRLGSSLLPRLALEQGDCADPKNPLEASLELTVREQLDASGARSRFLSVSAKSAFKVPCGRCLKPVDAKVLFDGEFLLVESESLAEELDTLDEPQDVIAAAQFLRADRLAEDELLMAMAPTYLHPECEPSIATAPERRNPFAALAALKKPT